MERFALILTTLLDLWVLYENIFLYNSATYIIFLDVVTIKETNDSFRLLFDTKGRFVLHRINEDEQKVGVVGRCMLEAANNKI